MGKQAGVGYGLALGFFNGVFSNLAADPKRHEAPPVEEKMIQLLGTFSNRDIVAVSDWVARQKNKTF